MACTGVSRRLSFSLPYLSVIPSSVVMPCTQGLQSTSTNLPTTRASHLRHHSQSLAAMILILCSCRFCLCSKISSQPLSTAIGGAGEPVLAHISTQDKFFSRGASGRLYSLPRSLHKGSQLGVSDRLGAFIQTEVFCGIDYRVSLVYYGIIEGNKNVNNLRFTSN